VATEPRIVELKVSPDTRLAAGAGGVARYFADTAGLSSEAIAKFQAAAVAACTEAFESLTSEHPFLRVTYGFFADRIEIALAHKGESAPAVGLDAIAGFAAPPAGALSAPILEGVDRIQYDTHGGEAVTRLTKYIGPGPAASR
jgi:hypothetical protein